MFLFFDVIMDRSYVIPILKITLLSISLWTTLESTLYSCIDASSIFSEHVLNEPRANKLWKLFYGMPLNINKAKKYHTFVRVEIICNVQDNACYDSKLMFAWQITFHQIQREWLASNITKMEILKNWYQIIVKTKGLFKQCYTLLQFLTTLWTFKV